MASKRPEKDEKVCYNCKYMFWGVGVGQGVRCWHPEHREENDKLMVIPHLRYSCDLFAWKENQTQ
ncbi:MAG: hypothetical protein ACO36I_18220 [Candidatus Latescibacterota bacterium]